MTCYICDPYRATPAGRAMSDDEWGEGCQDCFMAFLSTFVKPCGELTLTMTPIDRAVSGGVL